MPKLKNEINKKDQIDTDEKWLQNMMNASGADISKALGPMSKEEYDYYENLPELKK